MDDLSRLANRFYDMVKFSAEDDEDFGLGPETERMHSGPETERMPRDFGERLDVARNKRDSNSPYYDDMMKDLVDLANGHYLDGISEQYLGWKPEHFRKLIEILRNN